MNESRPFLLINREEGRKGGRKGGKRGREEKEVESREMNKMAKRVNAVCER